MRSLIVNADDFGQSPGVNLGVIAAHEQGIVTSASLMVRWPAAPAAASYALRDPGLSLGLHIDLGEQAFHEGSWVPVHEVVDLTDAAAVRAEIAGQVALFRDLLGRDPRHLDSHQHAHVREPARSALLETARRLSVPLRHLTPDARYCGKFYGQTAEGAPFPEAISGENLLSILAALEPGVTELACHPGLGRDLDSTYGEERAREVAVLCDPRVRAGLEALGIRLATFDDLAHFQPDSSPP